MSTSGWDLDITNYTETELLELFGIKHNDATDVKVNSLVVALKKVKCDVSKTAEESADFEHFVFDVAEQLGISNNQIKMYIDSLTDIETKDMLFTTKQPFTQVNEHVIMSDDARKNAILKRHEVEGHAVNEAIYPSGIINPNKIHTLYKAINIDSRFRNAYFNTPSANFTVNLPSKITECVKLQLSSLTIPMTMYAFSETLGNTSFVVTTTGVDASANPINLRYVLNIPNGNYTTSLYNNATLLKIENIINNVMINAGIPATDLIFNIDHISGKSVFLTPTGTTLTGFKVEFSCDSSGVILTDYNSQLRLGWALGFRMNTYNATGSSPTLISEGICIPTMPRYIFLAVDDFQSSGTANYFSTGFQSSLLPNNILTRIETCSLLEGSSSGTGFYTLGGCNTSFNTTSLNSSRTYFGPVTIEKLKLTLYDEYGRVIDLNNMDWSVSFSFECIYEQK